jgi:hypothetical protein
MTDPITRYLLTGVCALFDNINPHSEQALSASREQKNAYEQAAKGRLAHFSVRARKKRLEENLISVIMNIDGKMRRNERPKTAFLLLRNRVKRTK